VTRQNALDIPPPVLVLSPDEDGVLLDLEGLLSTRLVIQGSSRSGKSRLLRSIVEQAAARIPVVVIDWEGEWHTLQEVHPFVWLGDVGEGADAPLRPSTARRLCRELVGAGASVVVDLSEMEADERREVAAAFLDELMHLPKTLRRAYLVAIDEAHELAPEGQAVESRAAVRALVSRGGKRGLCPIAVTQRLSRLDKSVAEAMNVLIGRTVLDVDVKRAADQLGFDKRQAQTLKELPRGRFYAYGPAIGDGSVQLVRSGEIRSHHPDGARLSGRPPTAKEIAAALATIRENPEAIDDAAGRAELVETIERLKRELQSAREGNTSDPADIRRAVDQATSPLNDEIRALRMTIERAKTHARLILLDAGEHPEDEYRDARKDVQADGDHLGAGTLAGPVPEQPGLGDRRSDAPASNDHGSPRSEVDGLRPGSGDHVGGPRRASVPRGEAGLTRRSPLDHPYAAKILEELATRRGPTHKAELATAIGASGLTSSTFRSVVGALKKAGRIRSPREFYVELAEAGP
jgi:hypothetical protein